MQRVILIGQNPGSHWVRGHIVGSTLRKAWAWMEHCGVKHFSFYNVYGELGSPRVGDTELAALKQATAGNYIVIALGRVASDALTKIHVQHIMMPHPSGRNRQLNDKRFEAAKVEGCRYYINSHVTSRRETHENDQTHNPISV